MHCDAFLKNLTVLFVEDEESLLQLLTSALGSKFHAFAVAKDGLEGLQLAKEMKPDIVISDITMPHMDGLTMAEKIHEIFSDMPIVILSAYSDQEKLLHAIDASIAKYFIKPFDPEELLEYLCTLAQKLYDTAAVKLLKPYRFDREHRKLLKGEHIVKLTLREVNLISHLIEAPNHVISNQEIRKIIGKNGEATDEGVRVFIRRLREKTEKDFIQNIPKQGYLLGQA